MCIIVVEYHWPLLLTWFNFNPSMDMHSHTQWSVEWNYLSIPKLQMCNRWNLGMDNQFHPTLCNGCNYFSMSVKCALEYNETRLVVHTQTCVSDEWTSLNRKDPWNGPYVDTECSVRARTIGSILYSVMFTGIWGLSRGHQVTLGHQATVKGMQTLRIIGHRWNVLILYTEAWTKMT